MKQLLKIRFIVTYNIVVMGFVEKLYLQNMCLLCKKLLTLFSVFKMFCGLCFGK
jgi:hypothetical protein